MSITVKINTTDISSEIKYNSLSVTRNLGQSGGHRCRFEIVGASSISKPQIDDEIIVQEDGNNLFGGNIENVNEIITSGGRYRYDVEAIGYSLQMNKRLVNETYSSETVNNIIDDLVTNYFSSFSTTNVDCTTTINSIEFNYKRGAECITKLANQVNYDWYVDADKDIHFFERGSISSPWDLTDSGGNYFYDTLQIKENYNDIKNYVIVEGKKPDTATPFTVTDSDSTSISNYGRHEFYKKDHSISTESEANQFASSFIEAWKNPSKEGKFITKKTGLEVGDEINISSTNRGISENFIICKIQSKPNTPNEFHHNISFKKQRVLDYYTSRVNEKEEIDNTKNSVDKHLESDPIDHKDNSITADAIKTDEISIGTWSGDADDITEGASNKFAAESGADITGNHTADNTNNVGSETASNVESGVERARNGLSSSYKITKGFVESDLSSISAPSTGVKIDSGGIYGYKSGSSTFYINSSGDAYFGGTLGADTVDTNQLVADAITADKIQNDAGTIVLESEGGVTFKMPASTGSNSNAGLIIEDSGGTSRLKMNDNAFVASYERAFAAASNTTGDFGSDWFMMYCDYDSVAGNNVGTLELPNTNGFLLKQSGGGMIMRGDGYIEELKVNDGFKLDTENRSSSSTRPLYLTEIGSDYCKAECRMDIMPDGFGQGQLGYSDAAWENVRTKAIRFYEASDNINGGEPDVEGDLIPVQYGSNSSWYELGQSTSGNYWYSLYVNKLYYKSDEGSFEEHEDIEMMKNIKEKDSVLEIKNKKTGKKEKKQRKVWDKKTYPNEVLGENGFTKGNEMFGFLIGTFKQLIEKVEKLEDEIESLK